MGSVELVDPSGGTVVDPPGPVVVVVVVDGRGPSVVGGNEKSGSLALHAAAAIAQTLSAAIRRILLIAAPGRVGTRAGFLRW